MSFARRLTVADAIATAKLRKRPVRIASFVDVQTRKPVSLIIEPDGKLTEVYGEDEELHTIDDVVETSSCPFDPLDHLMSHGKCLRCGGTD